MRNELRFWLAFCGSFIGHFWLGAYLLSLAPEEGWWLFPAFITWAVFCIIGSVVVASWFAERGGGE